MKRAARGGRVRRGTDKAVPAPVPSRSPYFPALCGGVALYLAGHALFRLRMTRTIGLHHIVAAGVAAALVAVVPHVSALAVGGALAVVLAGASVWERFELRDVRRRQRQA